MKIIEQGLPLACLCCLFTFSLHGCGSSTSGSARASSQQPVYLTDKLPAPGSKPGSKGVVGNAKCSGNNFKCDGAWRSWCAKQEKACGKPKCTPLCHWQCNSPRCSQHCGPVCNEPVCSTRCKGFNTHSCKMKCGKPNCKVVCPKHFCPTQDCAACKTTCGKPKCVMDCGKDKQPCRNVCAQPVCHWQCKRPDLCPKPKCSMKCEKMGKCDKTKIFTKIPPLEPGEVEVDHFAAKPHCSTEKGEHCIFPFKYKVKGDHFKYSGCTNELADGTKAAFHWCPTKLEADGIHFKGNSKHWGKCNDACPIEKNPKDFLQIGGSAPSLNAEASLLQSSSSAYMKVNYTRMADDHSLHHGQVELAMEQVDTTDMEDETRMDSWSRQVREHEGQVIESEASCASGNFKCQGDASWCAAQEKELCVVVKTKNLRQRPEQSHLQA